MSVRWKRGRPVVEIYDPQLGRKRHVKAAEVGMSPPPRDASPRTLQQWAKRVERAALAARDERRAHRGAGKETCGSFAARWPDDYRRGRGRMRSESTTEHNRERVRGWGRAHADVPLADYTRAQAREWANGRPGSVPALRAMFSDAASDGLCQTNPFARLGVNRRGRADITVLTRAEVDALAELAAAIHGPAFGPEVAALITWSAYTCMRPGETAAARHSLLDGDTYHIRAAYNSRLGRESDPKHTSVGEIYVPEQAARAVADKPRRLDVTDPDRIFSTKTGRQFRGSTFHNTWSPVRDAFTAALPAGHHLRQRLAVDPSDRLDLYELRHFGAAHMLNDLGLEPWVIAQQLRHSDGGALVVELYGHPDRREAINRIRRAYTGASLTSLPAPAARRARG